MVINANDIVDLAVRAELEAAGCQVTELARAALGSGVRANDGRPLPRYEQDELSRVLSGGPATPPA